MVVETIRCSASLCTARASPSWQQEQRAYVFRRQSSLHQCDLLAARSVGEMPASKCRDIYTRRDLLPITITDSERGNGQPGRREREVGFTLREDLFEDAHAPGCANLAASYPIVTLLRYRQRTSVRGRKTMMISGSGYTATRLGLFARLNELNSLLAMYLKGPQRRVSRAIAESCV